MTATQDHYKALGVPKNATPAEIKRAYRRLARQFHPDVTGDDPRSTERFKEITVAYEVLSDPRRRRQYDLFGSASARAGAASPTDPFADIADTLADVLRRAQRRSAAPEPGVDIERSIDVTLAEAARGCEKDIAVDVIRICEPCAGQGWPPEKPPEQCPECNGAGTRAGALPFKRSCGRCDGEGTIRRYTCKSCAGEGQRKTQDTLKVTVPAGVDTGTRLRLKSRGDAGRRGGRPGDLYVVVNVLPDQRFERDSADLKTTLRVGLRAALLGGRAEVPLPNGTAVMTIPAGTQGGQIFRLRGRGMPRLGEERPGDLFVTVQVQIPRDLRPDVRPVVEQLIATLEQASANTT